MNHTLEISEVLLIGSNTHYHFYVGKIGSRWIGYATGVARGMDVAFLFPELSDGAQLGLANRNQAIRLTSAVACDPQSGYGGIKSWRIPPRLRGNPEDFRCDACGQLACDGACQEEGGS